MRRRVITSKILNPTKRKSRNLGFEADMLIIFKFPYIFFLNTS